MKMTGRTGRIMQESTVMESRRPGQNTTDAHAHGAVVRMFTRRPDPVQVGMGHVGDAGVTILAACIRPLVGKGAWQ